MKSEKYRGFTIKFSPVSPLYVEYQIFKGSHELFGLEGAESSKEDALAQAKEVIDIGISKPWHFGKNTMKFFDTMR